MIRQYLALPTAIHILCLGAFVNRAGTFLVPFLTLYLQKELNLGIAFATRAMGAYGVGSLVAFLVGGHLADLIGRRTVMLISLLGAAAILLVFGSLSSAWVIVAALVLFAVIAEMYRPAASAMIADLVSPQSRPHAFSLMYVAINLGFSVAAVVGGFLAIYSFQWLFWGDALTATAYAVIIFVAIRETLPLRRKGQHASAAKTEMLPGCPPPAPGDGEQWPMGQAFRHVLADRVFLVVCFATFCAASMYMQAMSTLPLYLQKLDMDSAAYGRIIGINGLMIALLQLPTTSIVARYNRGRMITLSAVVTAAGFGLIGVAVEQWHFALTTVIWTCGEMMNAPLVSSVVSDLSPTHLRARYQGAYAMCFSLALMIGAPIGGMVLEHLGGKILWGGSAIVALIAAMMYWTVRNRVYGPE